MPPTQKQPDTFLGGTKAEEAKQPLLTYSESKALWEKHNQAAKPARAAGACWQCCAEVGCRATDRPDNEQDIKRPRFHLHDECMKRIARAGRNLQ